MNLINSIIKLLSIFFFLQPVLLSGQDTHVENLLKKGDSLLFIKQHDKARSLYEEAKIYSEKNRLDYLKQFSTYKIGYSYLREDSEFLAMAYFTEVQIDLIPETRRDSALYFLVSLEIDVISYNTVKSGYNPLVIEEQVSQYSTCLGDNEQSRIQYLLAKVFVQRLEHIEAIECFKALLNDHIPDPWLYELSIFGVAVEYEMQQEFQQAIEYYTVLSEINFGYIREITWLERISYNYFKMRDYESTLRSLTKGIQVCTEDSNSSSYIINNYLFQGNCYYIKGEKERATSLYNKAEYLAKRNNSNKDLVYVYLTKIYFFRMNDNFEGAKIYLDKALNLDYGSFTTKLSKLQIYNQAIKFYTHTDNYSIALQLVKSFEDSIPISDLPFDRGTYLSEFRSFNITKGLLLRKIWEEDSTNVISLEKAHKTFKDVLKISQGLYSNLEHEKTKLRVVSNLRIDYENLFLTSYNLYNITKDKKYLEEIFLYQQQGKATLFKSILHESEALYTANIPEDLLQKEVDLRKQIERLNYYINPTSSTNLNEEVQQNLHEELVHTKISYDSLMNHLEEDYPNYQQQKYGIENYSIKDIQEFLEEDQLVIDYFITEGRLFKMLINKSKVFVLESKLQGDLQSDIVAYREILQDANSNNIDEFAALSFKLYQVLLGDVDSLISGKRLFVVPDKELNLIPFETLMISSIDSLTNKTFGLLPYLVKNNPISIFYSQSQLLDKNNTLSKNSKLIAFAPEYSLMQNRNLVELEGAKGEVKRISEYYRGKNYIGESATKGTFVNEASKYDILHLALHTVINDNNPKHSQLVFSGGVNPDDAYLTSYEVYGMRFNAVLLVLSGCNTGSGELKSGEGVMHLARDFFFAGINNIVFTQWAVADKSSASMMEYFYKYLHDGNPVDIALQKAKIDFIQKEDPLKHHPYYWSGYISSGKPAEYRRSLSWHYLFLLLFIPISFYFAVRKKGNNYIPNK